MTSSELRQYKSVQNWLEGLDPTTQKRYLQHFRHFLKYVNMTPDQLLEVRRQDVKSADTEQQRRFERIAKAYYEGILTEFKKEGKSEGHAWNFVKAVMSFFSRNYTPLKFKRKELKQPKQKLKRTGLTIEKLKEAYEILDVRERAIFTTLLQTGLSPIDACAMDIEPIISELDNPPIYIEGYRTKTEVGYQTCIGEDSAIAIKKYLILRGNPTTGALFLVRTGERLSPRFLRESLEPKVRKVIPKFQIKDLRDVYHDALERVEGISEKLRDRMFGHEIGTSTKAYEFSPTTIREAYLKAYEFLQINGATRERGKDRIYKWLFVKLAEIIASDNPRIQAAKLIDEIKAQSGEAIPTPTPEAIEKQLKEDILERARILYPDKPEKLSRITNTLKYAKSIREIEKDISKDPELKQFVRRFKPTDPLKELPKTLEKFLESA